MSTFRFALLSTRMTPCSRSASAHQSRPPIDGNGDTSYAFRVINPGLIMECAYDIRISDQSGSLTPDTILHARQTLEVGRKTDVAARAASGSGDRRAVHA